MILVATVQVSKLPSKMTPFKQRNSMISTSTVEYQRHAKKYFPPLCHAAGGYLVFMVVENVRLRGMGRWIRHRVQRVDRVRHWPQLLRRWIVGLHVADQMKKGSSHAEMVLTSSNCRFRAHLEL